MVDYTKWDKMEFSDSDDDDEDESSGAPRVTSLNHPGKVTIGTDGTLNIAHSDIIPSSQSRESLETQKIQSKQPTQLNKKGAALPTVSGSKSGDTIDISNSNDILVNNMSMQQQHTNTMQQYKSKLTSNGGEHYCKVTLPTTATSSSSSSPNTPNNKSTKEMKLPIYWSQDRYTITLRMAFTSFIFPTKNIRVRVNGALQYSDRYSAVGSGIMNGGYKSSAVNESGYGSVEIVSITSNQGKDEEIILLQGKLPHPIHLNQDEDDIDFEIEDNLIVVDVGGDDDSKKECIAKNNKFVTIIMPKAVPMSGMVIWWDCPLIGYPKIDVSAINDRNKRGGGDDETTTQQEKKKEAFQVAWEEAHKMFKEKMKTREKQEIDVND